MFNLFITLVVLVCSNLAGVILLFNTLESHVQTMWQVARETRMSLSAAEALGYWLLFILFGVLLTLASLGGLWWAFGSSSLTWIIIRLVCVGPLFLFTTMVVASSLGVLMKGKSHLDRLGEQAVDRGFLLKVRLINFLRFLGILLTAYGPVALLIWDIVATER